jgi:predicted RNA-binding protein with PIN domain
MAQPADVDGPEGPEGVLSDEVDHPLEELPEAVRGRIVALAADSLPDVVRLPAPLRRVAAFAPARRARLGGRAIAAALGDDAEFRERVATQATARATYDVRTAVPGDGDPVEVAALAWLVRPEGWGALLADAVDRLRDRPAPGRESVEVERLAGRLADAEQALRDLRARHREQVEEYKTENASLRRKLGESRAAHRAEREQAEEAVRQAQEAQGVAETLAAGQEKELRRLRGQVAQWEARSEAQSSADRRAARSERDEVTLRARMLLDTVIDAASGLRRELALPPVDGAPADRFESGLAEAGQEELRASVGPSSPALLERFLGLPRARLIVDGYNVTKTSWPSSSLEAQRIRLLSALAPLVARTGAETTVVFDGADADARRVMAAPRGVKVLFSPRGVIADDVIRELVAEEPPGRVVVVVTSDRELAGDVGRAGARAIGSDALIRLLGRNG